MNPAEIVDDLVQDVYLKIAANRGQVLKRFVEQDPDSVYPYLKVIAINLVTDYCRANEAARRRASQTVPLRAEMIANSLAVNPSAEVDRNLLLGRVDVIVKSQTTGATSERDRSVFWLYYRQGLTAKAIASIPSVGLSIKGVEALLHRLTEIVRAKIAAMPAGCEPFTGKRGQNPLCKENEV